MQTFKTHKFLISIVFLLVIFFAAVFSNHLIENSSIIKPTVEKTKLEENSSDNISVEEGNNSANVKSEQTSQNSAGTCKVTRNGVVTIVPADQVNINESSAGDINVKVECDNSTSSSTNNSSNKTSIKNDIDVNVNTSN